jgi:hypothetical protein
MALPSGVGADAAFARKIAGDAEKLSAAIEYWRVQFAALGETVLDTGSFASEAMRFASALEDQPLESMTPEFRGFFSADDSAKMVSASGCLMSLENVAATYELRDPAVLPGEFRHLGSFAASGAISGAERDRLATCLRLAREVHDTLRRYGLCTSNAADLGVTRSELLAIFRQEGSLGIAPSKPSWSHAPVIPTAAGAACRRHEIFLWDRSADRHGWVVSYDRDTVSTPSRSNMVSLSFGVAIRHAVIIGGLDSLVLPRLADGDELLVLYECTRKGRAGSYPALEQLKRDVLRNLSTKPTTAGQIARRQSLLTSQADIFDGILIGHIMFRLDTLGASALTSEAELLNQAQDDIRKLLAVHPVKMDGTHRVFLAPADGDEDARVCLRLQASWYVTRKEVQTLLARRDRAAYAGANAMAPILAYLRYNIGEINFVRVLIRFADAIVKLKNPRSATARALQPAFAARLARIGWTTSDQSLARKLQDNWRVIGRSSVGISPGWRHLGLIDALAVHGSVCTKAPVASRGMQLAADTAKQVIDLYQNKGLFELLAEFILSHPITTYNSAGLDIVGFDRLDAGRQPLRNAFSFERLRRAYAQAHVRAGLTD